MQNLIGTKHGMLTVLSKSSLSIDLSDLDPNSLWDCQCDCGNKRTIKRNRLRKSSVREGSILSCGCANKQKGLKLRKDPILGSAKNVWSCKYSDGCSFEKFLELSQKECFWCGALPKNKSVGNCTKNPNTSLSKEWVDIKINNPFIYNGLDRLDSTKDHSEDNVVPCCADCNRAKMDRTVEDFLSWINKVYFKQLKKKNE